MSEPIQFSISQVDHIQLASSSKTVVEYFDNHPDWFQRCAQPMRAELIGIDTYALTIGRFGAFGYEVEPKIGLSLLRFTEEDYRIQTVPVAGYKPPGYEVDFQAALALVETIPNSETAIAEAKTTTCVHWQLELRVDIYFPRFIQALPRPLIQRTGNELLSRIVKEISRQVNQKVQADFEQTYSQITNEI